MLFLALDATSNELNDAAQHARQENDDERLGARIETIQSSPDEDGKTDPSNGKNKSAAFR